MPAEAVIFDLDGVLVDSVAAITGCMNSALSEHGQPTHPTECLKRYIGPPLVGAFSEIVGEPVDSPLVASLVESYRRRYETVSLRDTTVMPGVTEVVREMARKHELAVATSKPLPFADPLLTAVGLRELFTVVSGPATDALQQPKARTIADALDGLGHPPRAVMIGDRSFDIVGAQAHGLPSIGVTWGIGDRPELEAAGADVIVDSPHQLAAAVESIFASSGSG